MKHCVVKLSLDRLAALGTLYKAALTSEMDMDELVFAHAKELHRRLKKMAVNENLNNTLSLNSVECIALIRLWDYDPVDMDPWYSEVLRSCTEAAHKFICNQSSTTTRFN